MKAIVLAGGFGTRIQPLTNSMPKPMLPILNRPMMEHTILKLRDELGIKDIAVLLYFKPEIIKNYFGDGTLLGVNISYVEPDDDYGTAGAVAFAHEFLDESFIIVSGDLITDFDFKLIANYHTKKKSLFTIALTPVENPLQFGVVIANQNGKIEKFLEKPSWGEVFSDTINTGIYLLEPEILDYIPKGENFDFAKDLFPLLMKQNITLWGCSIEGYWRDVGNPNSYREVYDDIFKGKIKLPILGEKKEFQDGTLFIQKDTNLPTDVTIKGLVVLGKNVQIKKSAVLENVVVGDNSTLGNGKISNSVIWNDTVILDQTEIKNGVICNNNQIGKKVIAKNGVIIAEKCEVGDNVRFEKDLLVWADKMVVKSAVVSNNVIWGKKYKSSIFQNGAVIGRTNIELSCQISTKLAESFGSILPMGSKIYISCDFHKSSRMLKRAFLSGILSTGVNVVDLLFDVPSNVMRYNLAEKDEIVAGVHFRQSVVAEVNTEIVFFTNEALFIDNNLSKSIERIFFRENFRRVNYQEIGEIYEDREVKTNYIDAVKDSLDLNLFKKNKLSVVVDIMFGSTSEIYPKIINELEVENIILNGYQNEKKISKIPQLMATAQKNVGNIVKTMKKSCGFLIYPNGQKFQIISDNGELVYDYIALLVILELLNETSKNIKVFLPAWAPDFIDYKNIEITRGKYGNFKAQNLKKYDLIANTDGNFAFGEFALHRDAIYSSFKILELIQKSGLKISQIVNSIPLFHYRGENIKCPSEKKGKMMRKFLEDSQGKKNSHTDGIKIWIDENDWILMVPDQYEDFLNIYIQAKNDKSANKIFDIYQQKIQKWLNE